MLKSVEILDKKLCDRIQRPPVVEVSPGITVLVGPNGSGKSTFLRAVATGNDQQRRVDVDGPLSLAYFDTETMNPRIANHFYNPNGGDATTVVAVSRFMSHGQMAGPILNAMPEGKRLIVIDEPEAGLDADAVALFTEKMVARARTGTQFLVASHHPVIWAAADGLVLFRQNADTSNYWFDVTARFARAIDKVRTIPRS